MRVFFPFLFLLISGNLAHSQTLTSEIVPARQDFSPAISLRLGADDLLVNGEVYLPAHAKANGHPYYPDAEWTAGAVYVKGRTYPGVSLLYDLVLDRPLLRTQLSDGQTVQLILVPALVDSFRIGAHLFVHARAVGLPAEEAGYFEAVYQGKARLLIRHEKHFVATYSNVSPFGSYASLRSRLFLLDAGQLIPVPDKGAFLAHFSYKKDPIKQFLRQHRIRYARATHAQLHQLMQYCDALP